MKKLLLFFFLLGQIVWAQNTPFNCDYNAYLFQFNDVYAIDLASGNSIEVATDITQGSINAAGYNPKDGYIWGSLSTPSKTIVRIAKDFVTTTFYIDELSNSGRYIGDVSADGIYYLKGGGSSYYKIDLDPASPNYGEHLATEIMSTNLNIHDWAFNANDGYLYTVEKKTNKLYRVDASDGTVQDLGEVPILSGLNYTYGAVYFDASGRFYVSANQTGTIYVIQSVQNLNGTNAIDSNLFAFGPSSSSNDGARCPTAEVPQEDCDNGVDDDGDGLVDCDDPSCSGQAECPIIEAPTSGGNEGGLESNNRLSELINKRNYNRAKSSYKFDKKAAKKFKKSVNYGKKAKGTSFNLQDLIPLDVINEDEVIESSPSDLVAITNASQLYAVDYLEQGNTIASILLLETENGVYEHSKYICDRLLGAELISVSTIEINEQQFIKSIIKNIDGSVEFVLSLSAKAVDNNSNFAIESHWNLDKYEENIPFYNFQIWTNSIDDLVRLGEEVVRLLEVQKPIVSYNNSAAPTVFVRKGKYINGKLNLEVVNTNNTDMVTFNAGIRSTETSDIDHITSSINLDEQYITNIEVATGNLFDVGFRIGDSEATPDDLFMSDGPWGLDDAAASTVVSEYAILPNEAAFKEGEYGVERNLSLTANTKEYVSAYRALTPRFKPVDLSAFKSFKFKAKGSGTLEVRFIKKSITSWEEQYKTSVSLTDHYKNFAIPFSEFKSTQGKDLMLNDIVSIVFTMVSEQGAVETKTMQVEQLSFSPIVELSEAKLLHQPVAVPNPVEGQTVIHFALENDQGVTVEVYNQIGTLIKEAEIQANKGINTYNLNRRGLKSGVYFCKIKRSETNFKVVKLLIK